MNRTSRILLPLCLLFVISCGQHTAVGPEEVSKSDWIPISFDPGEIEIRGDLNGFTPFWEQEEVADGLIILTLNLKSPQPAVPPRFSLQWDFPSVDVYGFWNSNVDVDKVTYYNNSVTSKAASQAPVLAFINDADTNRFTFACSDALNQLRLRSYVREEDAKFYCSVDLFGEKTPAMTEYSIQIRVDRRPVPYYVALRQVSDWWASQENYTPASVPEVARMPMYSTWYSFHQSITADEVVNQCRLAKEMGFEAVIVDDGWQTLDSRRGYAYTGDWKPERIPDMKSFVDRVHELGMKFLLWYSVPFIGEKAENYGRFKGKYLRYWDGQGAYVLDPRYPEVREFIIQTYETALREWNLDGFKLDFIGFFQAVEDTVMTQADGRDFASVNEAAERLMTDILARLREYKPEIMIEFRQRYIGPLMRKYGNMFRATDCPNMAVVNRARTTDVRLLCGNTAPHSDMFMWHVEESVEKAALQILNILFSVPQLSVLLDKVPPDHVKMIQFWIQYWKENRHVLLDGEFIPQNPGAVYPLLLSKTEEKTIAALYNDMVVRIEPGNRNQWDVVNAKSSEAVVLDIADPIGKVTVSIYDCLGEQIFQNTEHLKRGVVKFAVPPSGLLSITK